MEIRQHREPLQQASIAPQALPTWPWLAGNPSGDPEPGGPGQPSEPGVPTQPTEPGEPTRPDQPPPAPVA
ncbi:hypothetical protein HA520_17615 [Azotobacter chroococcum]|uniref:Uncharacterized protein n=1 Tax=Azotobacter chroococcum TaxID=353 RepID=A0AA43Z8U1_9GAMM|nr:hypothetical protein [Azotobacter chroococcum]NHN79078.1 hypothetical protein [Azotobacter chroococcum]